MCHYPVFVAVCDMGSSCGCVFRLLLGRKLEMSSSSAGSYLFKTYLVNTMKDSINHMKISLNYILKVSIVLLLFLNISCTSQQDNSGNKDNAKDPLELILEGHKRFIENHPIHPHQTLDRIRELKKGQHPFAAVISCSDSRIPPELIFDQGLGDLFVVRNAGNIISDYELGSIEYAVEHLGTKLIIVLGHKQCGAIKAFIDHKHDQVHNHIQNIIDYIKSEPEEAEIEAEVSDYYDKAIIANIKHGIHVIEQSEPILKKFVQSGKVKVVGMLYDVETGHLEIIEN